MAALDRLVAVFRAIGYISLDNFPLLDVQYPTEACTKPSDQSFLYHGRDHIRPEKEQDAVLGTLDKVLAGLRALSSSLEPSLYHLVRAALLPLVAQAGFTKKVNWVISTSSIVYRKVYRKTRRTANAK